MEAWCEENDIVIKNFMCTLISLILIYVNVPIHIWLLYFVPVFNIRIELCNWHFPNVTFSTIIFWIIIFNICIKFIWINTAYIILFFVAPYCNVTVPLFQHCVIKNGPLCGVSYLYAAWLSIMTLSLTL